MVSWSVECGFDFLAKSVFKRLFYYDRFGEVDHVVNVED